MRTQSTAPPVAETRTSPRRRRTDDAVIAQYIQDLSRTSSREIEDLTQAS